MAVLAHELIHCYNELYETDDYLKRKRDQSSRGEKLDYMGVIFLFLIKKKSLRLK